MFHCRQCIYALQHDSIPPFPHTTRLSLLTTALQVFDDGSGVLYEQIDYDVDALSIISNEVDSLLLCQSDNVMEVKGLVHATDS